MVECTVNLSSKLWLLPLAVLLTCVSAAFFCGFYVVSPGVQGMDFTRSIECTTSSASTLSNITMRCGCGRSCKSEYPCVKIQVTYNASASSVNQNAMLYNNEVAMSLTPKCSIRLPACSSDKTENRQQVMSFFQRYRVSGHKFACLVSTSRPNKVILDTKYNLVAMVISLFVPLIIISVILPMLLLVIYRRFCKRESHVIIQIRCYVDQCCANYSGVSTSEEV